MIEELSAYLLEELDPERKAAIEAQLATSPDMRAALASLQAALDRMPEHLPAATPSPGLRDRLVASLEADPFAPFSDRLAALFDLSADAVRAVLDRAKQPKAWSAFAPGIWLLHVEGGLLTAGADVGLVRVAAHGRFPGHRHGGPERTLILQGEMQDDAGPPRSPGTFVELPPGSQHGFLVPSDEDLVYAVVAWDVQLGARYHVRRLLGLLRERLARK